MSDKTEKPTRKRLREARRKGQVAKSQDLSSAIMLLAGAGVLWASGAHASRQMGALMRDTIFHAGRFEGGLDEAAALTALAKAATALLFALAPLFVVLVSVALLVNYLQVGSVLSFEVLKPNLNKLNPVEGFKNKFGKPKQYLEFGKTLLKMTIAAVLVGTTFWNARADIAQLTRQPIPRVLHLSTSLLAAAAFKVGGAFLLLGAGDFFLQKFLHLNDMKMSKDEVKREYKESEGDPHYKAARKRMHREILSQNTKAAVRKADVVVVNPTHVAVALSYDRLRMGAPQVVAKGADLMAAHIRRLAEEARVPVMRDVPLARSLYDLEIEDEIPEQLYEAVAVVLRWVYKLAEERGEVKRGG